MADEERLEGGMLVKEDGSWRLPAIARAPGANGFHYNAPLYAAEIKPNGILVIDAQDLRAALYAIDKQMKSQGTKPARLPRRKRTAVR